MSPDPVAFSLGPLVFRWYGILIIGGALLAAWVAARYAKWRGQNPTHVWDIFVYVLLGGILGARLYHVLSSPAGSQAGPLYYFVERPFTTITIGSLNIPFPAALAIWEGGLGIYGAIVGGVLVLWLYTRRNDLHFPTWLDIGAVGIVVGQAIGRWGNFFNQELYGLPTTLPWGIPIAPERRLAEYASLPDDTRFHPTFLYESLWSALTLGLLLWVSRRFADKLRPGDIFSLYLISYGIGRFLVEFQRPDAWRMGPLATAQWIGIGIAILGVALIAWQHRQQVSYPYRMTKDASRAQRRRQRRQGAEN